MTMPKSTHWLLLSLVMTLFFQLPAWAQTSPVKGIVREATTKELIVGASIKVKNTSIGTTSGLDGTFSIQAKQGDELIVSFIGYQTITVPVTGNHVEVALPVSSKQLNDVVVTALGIRKEVKKVGYAVQEVKGEDLVKARDQNPLTGLTGKVAGLSVGASAELLSKPTVLLRGNEITLYVVDGIPVSSDTWNLSPDDIESYTVLKGPAAAALYGSRAQYGAILITTKKGTKKKGFTVEFNSSNAFDRGFLAFPRTQDEYGPGENGLYSFVDGKGGGLNDNDYDVWGPRFEGQLIAQYDSPVDPVTGKRTPTPWVARGKNNLKRFLQTGFQTTDNLALSASGDNYNLRFSVSQSYQKAIIPNMSLNITNFNMYGSYNPTDRLRLEANINYNRQYTPNYPDVDYGPNSLIYNIAIWTGADWNIDDMRNYWQKGKEGTQSIFAEYQRYHNPYFMVNEWLRGHYKTDVYGYVSANYKISNGLNATLRTQITGYDLFRNEKMPFSAHPYGREGNMGDYREDKRNLFENNTELLLNYNYNIGRFVNLSGLVGGNARNFEYRSSFTSTDYLQTPNVYDFGNSLNNIQASSFASQMRVLSAYYSLDASFGKYLTLSSTGRVDKSSAAPGQATYFYPSVSLATPVSDYVKLPEFISFLKARASFANVKGDATSSVIGMAPYNSITALGGSPTGSSLFDYPLGYGSNYLSPYGGPDYSLNSNYNTSKTYNNQPDAHGTTKLFDAGLKPFTRVNYEEGLDIRFLENRLGLSATAFQYVDGPRILPNPISTASGGQVEVLNGLTTKKTGYELSLTGSPLKSAKGLNWDILVNYASFVDKYKELPDGQKVFNQFFHVGDRVDKLYGSAFFRDPVGNIIYSGGTPLANQVSQYLGNLNSKFDWSIYNKFSYQGVSLGFQFDGRVGGKMVDYMHNKTMRGGRNIETVQGKLGASRLDDFNNAGKSGYEGTYVGDGVVVSNGTAIQYNSTTGAITNYKDLVFTPNTVTSNVQGFVSSYYNVDEANLMSKTYAKLREVTLGYDLPHALVSKAGLSKVSVSLIGRNLLYFYKDKRFKDVDLDQYNATQNTTSTVPSLITATALQSPTTRRYGFNLNVVF
ncbi:SusC/RagA family TonB-linked outer membrane protein [Chitinophaga parva]|nr:SusC/RagA family TonB-linked outer membrane protein [Chitinophaga parva]